VIQFKSGNVSVAHDLAELMHPLISKCAAVVPIPTSPEKMEMRGFDTIGLLAKNLQRLASTRKVIPALALARNTSDQVGLSAPARMENMQHAFRANCAIAGKVTLIDDVLTTGATLMEARRALIIAGASEVDAVVLCASPQKRYG
jgi:predicted amidophosphoribosyltransferase